MSTPTSALAPGLAERRTRLVVALNAAVMGVELVAGHVYGSMALVADGWHMVSHTLALGIALVAYAYARRHAKDGASDLETARVHALGGFASAVLLAVIALWMGFESLRRLMSPQPIELDEALVVAVLGLIVNGVSALLLGGAAHEHTHDHDHDHEHDHDHDHGQAPDHGHDAHHHDDHNLTGAYLHVLADALTSVLAIAALLLGKLYGWLFADPLMGLAGGAIVLRWAWGLLRSTSRVLVAPAPRV